MSLDSHQQVDNLLSGQQNLNRITNVGPKIMYFTKQD